MSAQTILVHGDAKFSELCKLSELPKKNPKFRPLHFDKSFNRYERKLKKYLDKANWYNSDKKSSSWRSRRPIEWKSEKPLQSKMPRFEFTSILQVQSSKNSRLLKDIAKVEPQLPKVQAII